MLIASCWIREKGSTEKWNFFVAGLVMWLYDKNFNLLVWLLRGSESSLGLGWSLFL